MWNNGYQPVRTEELAEDSSEAALAPGTEHGSERLRWIAVGAMVIIVPTMYLVLRCFF